MWDHVGQQTERVWTKLKERIFRRRLAYRTALLDEKGLPSVAGDLVLRDLAAFCRAYQTTACFSPVTGQMDALASARADGRREVFLRIVQHLQLNEAVLYGLAQQQQE